jgi:hypothetical protein
MSILISLIILCVVLGLLWWLISMLPIPEPFGLVVRVCFILLAIIFIVERFGLLTGSARL